MPAVGTLALPANGSPVVPVSSARQSRTLRCDYGWPAPTDASNQDGVETKLARAVRRDHQAEGRQRQDILVPVVPLGEPAIRVCGEDGPNHCGAQQQCGHWSHESEDQRGASDQFEICGEVRGYRWCRNAPGFESSCRGIDSVRVLRLAVHDEDHAQRCSTDEDGDVADGSDGGLHAVHAHGRTCGCHRSHVNLIGLAIVRTS